MKRKRILSVMLSLLMLLSLMPLTVFTASAQECVWDFWINGSYVSDTDLASKVLPGLSLEGSTLVLTNFEGESIAAIPGGNYGDDDAPVLNIRLVGENKLTGSYFKYTTATGLIPYGDEKMTGNGCFFGALISEPRAGGFGDGSMINISGDGSLEISTKKSYSQRTVTFGGKPTTITTVSDVDILPVFCDELNINGGKTTVIFGGAGVTAAKATGVFGNVTVNAGVLDVRADVSTARIRTSGKIINHSSTCAVTGVEGDVLTKANKGYFSSDLASVKSTSSELYAVDGNASYQNGYGALYLSAPAGGKTVTGTLQFPSSWKENVSYRKFAFSDSKYVYEAYGPMQVDELQFNTSLTELYAGYVADVMTFPAIGEDQLYEDDYSRYSDFFMRERSYKVDAADGQTWSSASWSVYEECDNSFLYQFSASFVPAPGKWYIPGQGSMSAESIKGSFEDHEPVNVTTFTTGFDADFFYAVPVITKQPAAVLYSGDYEVSVEASIKKGDLAYEWRMAVYNGDELASDFAVGAHYGEMDGFEDTETDTMRIGGFTETDEVPDTESLTFGDASKILVYCKVSGIGASVESNKAEYKLFEDSKLTVKTQAKDAVLGSDGKATFTFVAEGDGVTYNWYMDGALLSSASNKPGQYGFGGVNTSTLTVVTESEMGQNILAGKKFVCVARDAHNAIVESAKVKIVIPTEAPDITVQPVDCEYIKGGDNPTFTVTATGKDLVYTWYWAGSPLKDGPIGGWAVSGTGTRTLTIDSKKSSFGSMAAKDIYCVVSNAGGSETSDTVHIVEISAPAFKTQPADCTAAPGTEAVFTAELEKTEGVTYQWYTEDGTVLTESDVTMWKLSGTNTNTLKVTPKVPFAYTAGIFYCVATYKGVEITSKTASLLKPSEEPSVLYGDVDNNKKVEVADARLALRAAIGLDTIAAGTNAFKAADVDFNSKIEPADARLILRYAVGLESKLGK